MIRFLIVLFGTVDGDFIANLQSSPSGTVINVCQIELRGRQEDNANEVFIPGVPVIAKITGVERMPRTHPFNPNL